MAKKSKAERVRSAAKNARTRAAAQRGLIVRNASAAASGYMLGAADSRGDLERIPTAFGIPRMAIVAVAGLGGAMLTKGTLSDALEGAGTSALAIAGYHKGSGQSVSGGDDASVDAELAQLQAELHAETIDGQGVYEDENIMAE